jgi:negative regulator of sigma E activity
VTRLRVLLVLTGLGALMTGVPVSAQVMGPDVGGQPATAQSAPAMLLLENAARAWRTRTWSGTQEIVSTRSGEPRLAVLRIQHAPGVGSAVRVVSSDSQAEQAVAADILDEKLLRLLGDHYELRVAGREGWAGRAADVVEARRPGTSGEAALAGRFWLDRETGLVLRRDVLDEAGSVVRSSAFVDLEVLPVAAATPVGYAEGKLVGPTGQHLDEVALARMSEDGWPVVRELPGRMELFESRLHDADGGDVLQLSYSDGLSTLSLFVQKGELPADTEGSVQSMGGATVRVWQSDLERVVWSGDGRTWTLVSDAPESVVGAAVGALPHAPARDEADGLAPRIWRGMSRVGSWLNPFE